MREARWRLESVKNKKVSHIKVNALAADSVHGILVV